MTVEDALLAAIIAAPDDDTPRLVYADWLDENGQPDRAEFIRAQCRVARPEEHNPADEERVDELENEHRRRWVAGLPGGPGVHWSFFRGFPERLDVPTALLLERYDRFAAIPLLRQLCLQSFYGPDSRDFVSRTWNPRWVELELWGVSGRGQADSQDMRAIVAVANTPQVSRLRSLRFAFFEFSRPAVEELAASPHLDGLHVLEVPGDRDRPLYAPLRERLGDRLVGGGE